MMGKRRAGQPRSLRADQRPQRRLEVGRPGRNNTGLQGRGEAFQRNLLEAVGDRRLPGEQRDQFDGLPPVLPIGEQPHDVDTNGATNAGSFALKAASTKSSGSLEATPTTADSRYLSLSPGQIATTARAASGEASKLPSAIRAFSRARGSGSAKMGEHGLTLSNVAVVLTFADKAEGVLADHRRPGRRARQAGAGDQVCRGRSVSRARSDGQKTSIPISRSSPGKKRPFSLLLH